MKQELVSQYQASLKMLITTITQCPDELWDTTGYQSPYWQIVYHSLHFTAFYLSKDEASFTPWADHCHGVHQLGTLGNLPASVVRAYPKADLKDYAVQIAATIDININEQGLADPSGFEWLAMNKFELHLYNLRHLQHHIGQLIERLHGAGIQGIAWIGSTP